MEFGILDMKHALGDILRDKCNIGHKGDRRWKTSAYNNASSKLSSQIQMTSMLIMPKTDIVD